jgi:pyridoxine 5-phosphate synthase
VLVIECKNANKDETIALGVDQIELHTGDYADAPHASRRAAQLVALRQGAAIAHARGMRVAAGHGLTVENVADVAAIPHVVELNIGHAIVADAVIVGMAEAVRAMRAAMDRGAAAR